MQPFRRLFASSRASGSVLFGATLFGPNSSQRESSQLVSVTELPVYEEPPPASNQAYYVEHSPVPALEQKVSDVRRRMNFRWPEGSEKTRQRIAHVYDTGKAHTQSSLEMLRDDSQVLPRAIVITAGGLLGLLLSYRRGYFRKLMYTSLGMGGAAALCYPNAAKDLTSAAYSQVTGMVKGLEKTANARLQTQQPSKQDNSIKQDVSKTSVALPEKLPSLDSSAKHDAATQASESKHH